MTVSFILLGAYAVNIAYIFKYRNEMLKFINSDYKALSEKIGCEVNTMVDLDSYQKFSILDLIPIFNIFYEKKNLEALKLCYEENKDKLCKRFPFIEKQYMLEEQAKNNTFENNQDKNYFIGVFEEGKPVNIFFTFNGEEAEILEGTNSKIINLPDNDAYMNLFYLLYCYYYGGEGINASYNIGEVYNEEMLNTLHNLFDEEQEEKLKEKEPDNGMKLTRKR